MSAGNIGADQLRLFVERIERLDAEIAGLQDDRREVYLEAKAVGFSASTLRSLIKRRKLDSHDRHEADALLEIYESALGMDEPLEIPSINVDAREQAEIMLAAQIEGMADPDMAEFLIMTTAGILIDREEVRAIQQEVKLKKQYAKSRGLDPLRIMDVVRWIEKCVKHGADAMRGADATYRLYRSTVGDAPPQLPGNVTDDAILAEKFSKPDTAKPAAGLKKASTAAALAAAANFAERATGINKGKK